MAEEKIEEIIRQIKSNQKEYIKIHNEKIEKYIPSRIKESGKTKDFIVKCIKEYIEREMIKRQKKWEQEFKEKIENS